MIYEFKEQDAYDFARNVGIEVKPHNGELVFKTCPYCKPKAVKGNTRTFSINLKTGQYKCLRASCGASGNMITLARDFDFSLGTTADEYYKPRKKYKRLQQKKEPIDPKPEAVQYMKSRGISEKIVKEYEITVQNNNSSILVFPFFDDNGVLQFVKYRDSKYFKGKTYIDRNGEKQESSKEWCEAGCKPILFGMKQCRGKECLVITEGQMDSLSVAEAGIYNAVSVPTGANGFTWIPYCWNWINQFHEVVVFGDCEKGKITLLEELSKRLRCRIKHVRMEDYKGCKDANEILQKYGRGYLKTCVERAVAVPVPKVIPLSDVEDVDIFNIQKLKTGLWQLDRLLYGGAPFGGVVLVAGKPGEGKSTLASQILVNAIFQGYKCFAYSGELPNYQFKAWIDFQIAGSGHIIENCNQWGDKSYNLSKKTRQLIADWYRDKCFLYDNTVIEDDEKKDLLEITENAIMQHGVKVILLDNLMTALDLECSISGAFDKYERQSLFIKKMARMALKHNALIILVVHKRKNNYSANENDEISGTGDISNIATLTITYEKNGEINESQRLLKVTKNRLFGKTETTGYILEYDEKSKRIYGKGDDPHVNYGWDLEDGWEYGNWEEETPFD